MKSLLVTWMLIAVTVSALAQSTQSPLAPPKLPTPAPASVKLKVGDLAPSFGLPNGDGKLVLLSEYTARSPVVLVFYRGYW